MNMSALPFVLGTSCLRSGALDKTYPIRTGDNSSLREADEQAVLHDAGNSGEFAGKRTWIGNAPQLSVKEPVPAIRDESMAVLVEPQWRRHGIALA
jgi:hypothetical protein